MQQKIVLIGGPGSGKTTVLTELINRNFMCFPEVSREVIKEAQKQGIDQLFLSNPLLFSKMLLEKRIKQFKEASKQTPKTIFFDRGIPEVIAYLNYFKTSYSIDFTTKSKKYKYDKVFLFTPWKEIYKTDNERYESFEQAKEINLHIKETYKNLGYAIIDVPFGTVKERTDFIINLL